MACNRQDCPRKTWITFHVYTNFDGTYLCPCHSRDATRRGKRQPGHQPVGLFLFRPFVVVSFIEARGERAIRWLIYAFVIEPATDRPANS